MECKGLIHIYCGDGKGKTTSAVGLAVRCAGGGGRVLFAQFLKNGKSGEINVLKDIENIDVFDTCKCSKFTFQMTTQEKESLSSNYICDFKEIENRVKNTAYDLLVLDEVLYGIDNGILEENTLLEFLNNKPYGLEVVLTGRNPSDLLCEMADYISDINKLKHPFDKGIKARKLIEG